MQRLTDAESIDILRTFCHVADPDPEEFTAYLKLYQHVTSPRLPAEQFLPRYAQILSSHQDICRHVLRLRSSCNDTLDEFRKREFPQATPAEQDQATKVIVQAAFMIDCASKDKYSANYKIQTDEVFPVKWDTRQTFVDFVESTFPTSVSSFRVGPAPRSLKAWKLKNRLDIRLIPTNDLAQHLLYDKDMKSLSIFHQVAFLKAHIRHTAGLALTEMAEESIKAGSLPPQLLVETLYSIQYILFPSSSEKKSAKLLRRLVNDKEEHLRFDPSILSHGGLIRPLPDNFRFLYWGERLNKLQHITSQPPPSNRILSWMERHASERNALTVAIFGLFLAVLFGLFGLLVGIAQLVVSILAWKYPVQVPPANDTTLR